MDLHASALGEVTTDGKLRVKNRGEVVAEIPNGALTIRGAGLPASDGEPAYLRRCSSSPSRRSAIRRAGRSLHAPARVTAIASKRWVVPPVRPHVATILVPCWHGRGVVRVKGTNRALAMSSLQRPLRLPRSVCGARLAVPSGAERRVRGGVRSAPPTASTSAIPSAPRSCGRSPVCRGMARRAGHWTFRSPGQRQPLQRTAAAGCSRHRLLGVVGLIEEGIRSSAVHSRPRAILSSCLATHATTWRQRIPESDA